MGQAKMKKLIIIIILLSPIISNAGQIVFKDSIIASADDGVHYAATGSITATSHSTGDISGVSYEMGFRLQAFNVPKGQIIDSAKATLVLAATGASETVNLIWKGEDTASSTQFTTDTATWNARIRTTASVAWNAVATGAAGTVYTSPNIGSIIQEIVGRTDWTLGNPLNLFLGNNSSSTNARRAWKTYDNAANVVLVLTTYYTVPDANGYLYNPDGALPLYKNGIVKSKYPL